MIPRLGQSNLKYAQHVSERLGAKFPLTSTPGYSVVRMMMLSREFLNWKQAQ